MPLDERAVSILRKEFPALAKQAGGPPAVFFDGPGGTQVHGSVLAAMERYLVEKNSNAHGSFSRSRSTDETVAEARLALADFLNARAPEEIVFGPNMTTLTFQVSHSIGQTLRPGDEVVVTRLDHDANVAPWRALRERGVVVREVDFDPADCTLDPRSLDAAITGRTRLVAVGYASNAVGTVNDVRRVVELAHAAGAWAYVDAVHYAPHGSIDVQTLGCDFLVCSAYKFFGPHVGALFGRREVLETLPAYKVRPAGDAPPDKFETGTPNYEGLAGATAAVVYLASVGRRFGKRPARDSSAAPSRRADLEAGLEAIRAYERGLLRRLLAGLEGIPGLRVYGITDPSRLDERVPTVSFTLGRLGAGEIARRLDEENVYVWDGHFYAPSVIERLRLEDRGGLVRVGLVHYSTEEEVDRLVGLLAQMARP